MQPHFHWLLTFFTDSHFSAGYQYRNRHQS
jgi:hypothetical protein